MKNLSNFSFREKSRDRGIVDRFAVIDGGGHPLEGSDEAGCCSSLERLHHHGTLCRDKDESILSDNHCHVCHTGKVEGRIVYRLSRPRFNNDLSEGMRITLS